MPDARSHSRNPADAVVLTIGVIVEDNEEELVAVTVTELEKERVWDSVLAAELEREVVSELVIEEDGATVSVAVTEPVRVKLMLAELEGLLVVVPVEDGVAAPVGDSV